MDQISQVAISVSAESTAGPKTSLVTLAFRPATEPAEPALSISDDPEEIHIIVAGGPGKHSCWMPTFGGMTRPVTVAL